MKVLIDANVILDYLLGRDEGNYGEKIIEKCYKGEVDGYVAFHSISIIWYILEKNKVKDRRDMIYDICEILGVVSINNEDVKKAVRWEEFKDFEDCLQEICAESINADYIVTNNITSDKLITNNIYKIITGGIEKEITIKQGKNNLYSIKEYIVKWENYDGTILEIDNNIGKDSFTFFDSDLPKKIKNKRDGKLKP